MCDDYHLGDKGHCSKGPELRNAEKPDNRADQQVGSTYDRQPVSADLLNQPRQRTPID